MTNSNKYDVIIVGAGPAGIICAYQLAKQHLKIALVEKEIFPRDKICGDALSLDVANQLQKIDIELAKRFKQLPFKMKTRGVKIISPSSESFDIPFQYKKEYKEAYVAKRKDIDFFLFKELKQFQNIHIFENSKVVKVQTSNANASLSFLQNELEIGLTATIIVGADGAQSFIAKSLSSNKLDKRYFSAGLRMYYNNVKGFNTDNYIELHFLKEILPGYLWLFPLPNNHANVGIGMLSKDISKNKVNLKKILKDLLNNHPSFKERFKEANALETVKGFGLPLGNPKRKISGQRFILLGDAAGLIDPFSGEGVGNAIRSGRISATHIANCFKSQDFSAKQNKKYDKEIYRLMGKEFKVSKKLQQLIRFPKLFNYLVKKANNNKELREFLIGTMENVEKKKLLTKLSFYYHLIFGRK